MYKVLAGLVLFLGSLSFGQGMRGPHHPRGHHHYSPTAQHHHGTKLTQDTQLLRDVEHIKEDLGDTVSKDATHKLTAEELEFHYFKLHDFDNNTKLDGLEILQAIRHTVHYNNKEEDEEHGDHATAPEEDPETNPDNFRYYVELIDQVLAEDDLDNDGYLSYIEYVVGRQKDQRRTAKQNSQ